MKKTKSIKSYFREDADPKDFRDWKAFLFLLNFTRSYKWLFIFAILSILISAGSATISAKFLGLLVDEGLTKGDRDRSLYYTYLTVMVEALSVAFMVMGRRGLARASRLSLLDVRKSMFSYFQVLPLNYFDREPLGRTVTRLTHDVEGLDQFFGNTLSRLIYSFLLLVIVSFLLLTLNLKLGLYIMISLSPALLVSIVIRHSVRQRNRKLSVQNAVLNAQLSEFLNGLGTIRIFGLEDWAYKIYHSKIGTYLQSCLQVNRLNAVSRPIISLFGLAPVFLVLYLGGLEVLSGAMAIGLFITIVRLTEKAARPMIALGQELHVIQQAFISAERVAQFLHHPSENKLLGPDGSIRADRITGDIRFDNVSMRYATGDEAWVLNNVSFAIAPGERIGLAGETGSGKSTTVSLVSRLYPFQSGQILIDHIPIEKYQRRSLRNKIGFVAQDPILFAGSLKDNLCCGADYPYNSLVAACHATGFSKVMASRKLDYDFVLTEKGLNLSVGERQLLALTRVLLKNPTMLIMDEATSNIDPEYEDLVHRAVDLIMENRSCLIIAHRLDTLKNCDRLLVFQNGKILESGSHNELIKQKSYYAELSQKYEG